MAAHPPTLLDRAYGVNNIKSHIPIILDNNDHNYDAWRELLLTHCQSFEVAGHLDGTLLPTDDNDQLWIKRDGLVKLWLYGTISKELFRSVFKTGGTSREIWTRIENYFRDNKEARDIRLDHELRNKTIGDLTIHTYCQDLKSISELLANVESPVSERTLVTYMINGLSAKFDNIINVIMHRQPFPTFEQARSMLILEEERLNKGDKSPLVKDSPSSDKVLNVSATSQPAATTQQPQQQQRFYNNRGSKRNNRGRGRNYNNNQRPMYNQWGVPFWPNAYSFWGNQQQAPWGQQQFNNQGILGPRPNQQAHQVQTQGQFPSAAPFCPNNGLCISVKHYDANGSY
ncbi:PREDICTED: uncharacterized protein LOC106297972 [Brassica oleracea var. oleracea]|uniref:uncharacterized protein LOC106297972 n=1 Tax=Brassica oleracea var. oleracea TaxID=109376 RepID=UPI0006A74F63|nr:PREDICTED: uncharacterized protein LOC106297972 [Brassica oleracea var. oleracea]